MELAGDNIQTLSMDHHGIVAAMCKDLGIAEKINSRINTADKRRIVSAGKAVVAIENNLLGPLYCPWPLRCETRCLFLTFGSITFAISQNTPRSTPS